MKRRNFLTLTIITVIAVIVAIVSSQREAMQPDHEKTSLFPELKATINELQSITLQQGEDTLVLLKQGDIWVIKEADFYPALFEKIRQTAVTLADMKILAEKTSDPDFYSRLHVSTADSKDAKSILLRLTGTADKDLATLIIGKQGPGGSSLYVRLPESEQALLVSGELDLSVSPNDWFNRDLLNIDSDRIHSVTTAHADGLSVHIHRDSPNKEYVLDNIPAGKEQDSSALGRVPSLLENIYIDSVKSAASINFPDTALTTSVKTFDGLIATITRAEIDAKHYIQLTFTAEDPVEQKTGAGEEGPVADVADVRQEAEGLNSVVSGWAYEIPGYKAELFSKSLDELTKEPETAEDTADADS